MTGTSARDNGVQQWGQLYRPLFLFQMQLPINGHP
jgi:predicted lipoprotein with Yx(FWY)xxD motif